MAVLLLHCHLVIDAYREYLDGALLIQDETIKEVYPQSGKIKNMPEGCEIIDLGGTLLMPGFFDTHTHGIDGMSFDSANKDELDKISYEFAREGSTSFLASLSYDLSPDDFDRQLSLFEGYESPFARFEGIHLEGPFLSKKHLGVGDPDRFLKPDIKIVEDFLNKSSKIRQMTIAYELDGAKEIGTLLKERGIKVMCGHSDALWQDLDENVDGFTHLFNAMRGLHHRDETLINAAFSDHYNIELIADGHHVKEDVLKLVINTIDKNKIMVVTDSSIARGLPDGEYIFISKPCTKKGTDFITFDGHYAGSVVSIPDELKVLYKLGAKYTDLLLYGGLNAFRFYGLDKKFGTLEKGKYADLVIMDDQLDIRDVYVAGRSVYA